MATLFDVEDNPLRIEPPSTCTKDGNLHRIERITGPAYNLPGIEFGKGGLADCRLEPLGPAGSQPDHLHDDEVKAWVLGRGAIRIGKTNWHPLHARTSRQRLPVLVRA